MLTAKLVCSDLLLLRPNCWLSALPLDEAGKEHGGRAASSQDIIIRRREYEFPGHWPHSDGNTAVAVEPADFGWLHLILDQSRMQRRKRLCLSIAEFGRVRSADLAQP